LTSNRSRLAKFPYYVGFFHRAVTARRLLVSYQTLADGLVGQFEALRESLPIGKFLDGWLGIGAQIRQRELGGYPGAVRVDP